MGRLLPNEWSELYRLNAMQDRGIAIAAISLQRRYIAFDNTLILPITDLIDSDGQPTNDIQECVAVEFGNDEVGYGTVAIARENDWSN